MIARGRPFDRTYDGLVACGMRSVQKTPNSCFNSVPTVARFIFVVLACQFGWKESGHTLGPLKKLERLNLPECQIVLTQGRRFFGRRHPCCPRVNDSAGRELTEVNNSQQM